MKEFRYSLAKKGKIVCANCGKKTAVPYIETETENIVENAMRCDREQNCGYHRKPESNDIVFIPKTDYKPRETTYVGIEILEEFFINGFEDNFVKFLKSIFTEEQVTKAIHDYFISSTHKGNTIFWQIDQLERVRSGKIMEYNSQTGKRVKDSDGKAHINWIHTYLKLREFNLKQCLFGLHLTKECRDKTIAIVESEKTAILMSVFEPEFLWLACGSKNGFKLDYLSPLKLRKIIGFPDKGCFIEWEKTAINLRELGFNIKVNDFLENEQCDEGEDIADNYLRDGYKG